ncbi:hypothetical protein N1851_009576 [Merluccius polli]|uniref:Uncharacterized protein n=1 Tax=Merluccius polli TaxID=89951 RepID=A0AA47N0U2_MERPO|nr:hypothetical protein N1851_009576 [Merluccius polli]
MVNQLGRLIPQLSEKDQPLQDLLSKKNYWLPNPFKTPPVLAMYNPECKVSPDTSFDGLGCRRLTLPPIQKWDEEWKPVAYTVTTEQRYAKVEKEALAPQIQRYQMWLICYSYSIAHVPGKCQWTVDMLSRAPVKMKTVAPNEN